VRSLATLAAEKRGQRAAQRLLDAEYVSTIFHLPFPARGVYCSTMKITVNSYDDSDDDCRRDTFYTVVDGKEYCLAPCALGTYRNWLEIQEEAKRLFGEDVEIEFAPESAICVTKP